MKIDAEKLKELCAEKGMNLGQVLQKAKVSRNAYYSLARKESVLPNSVIRLAEVLGVAPSDFLEEPGPEVRNMRSLLAEVERIKKHYKNINPDTVRHTLILLEEKPVDRLRRALLRGRKIDIHQ